MKRAVASLLLFLAASSTYAGSFGGPPPFTNGSPLPTGVDGSYQAIARGNNLSGVFRFAYSSNRQTSSSTATITNGVLTDPYNDYVFFVEGIVYRGLVQANIDTSTVGGVLDNGGARVPNSSSGSGTFLNILAFMSGYFNGKMDMSSPSFNFSGKGEVQTYSIIPGATTADPSTFVPGSTIDFKFNGVRNSSSSS